MIKIVSNLLEVMDSLLDRRSSGMKNRFTVKDNLYMRHFRDGKVIEEKSLGHNLLVDDGMEFIVDAWQNIVELEDMKYHDTGIGTTSPTAGDSAMETATTFSRATGTTIEGDNAREFKSVGTVSCTATKAITEWGIWSAASGGVIGARNTFAAINVVNGDSVEFTWECQLSAS